MPRIPAGYADCSLKITNNAMTRACYLTLGVDCETLTPDVIASKVFNAVAVTGGLTSILSNTCVLRECVVRVGHELEEPEIGTYAQNVTGSRVEVSPPANVAVLVSKKTNRGGRRGRGRWFLPWAVKEDAVDEAGQINPVITTNTQTAMTKVFTELIAQAVPMVLLHDEYTTLNPLPEPVTALVVSNLVSTQRRRLGR